MGHTGPLSQGQQSLRFGRQPRPGWNPSVPSLAQVGMGNAWGTQQCGGDDVFHCDARWRPLGGQALLGGGYGGPGRGAGCAAAAGSPWPRRPCPQALWPPAQVLLWQSSGEAQGGEQGRRPGRKWGTGEGRAEGQMWRRRSVQRGMRVCRGQGCRDPGTPLTPRLPPAGAPAPRL